MYEAVLEMIEQIGSKVFASAWKKANGYPKCGQKITLGACRCKILRKDHKTVHSLYERNSLTSFISLPRHALSRQSFHRSIPQMLEIHQVLFGVISLKRTYEEPIV